MVYSPFVLPLNTRMHIIDQMLALQSSGNFHDAFSLCESIHQKGPAQFIDADGLADQTTWQKFVFNRGWFLLWQGLYNEGHRLLENGRSLGAYGRPPLTTGKPLFNPQEHDLRGAKVLINLEGGLGDQIIAVRFARSYRQQGARSVTVVCDPALVSLFDRVPGVDRAVAYGHDLSAVEHDYWLPGFSAGWLIGHELRDLPNDPYLTADLDLRLSWNQCLDSKKKKIGIRWAGSPKFADDELRTVPPEFLFDLANYQDLQLYSLQKDPGSVGIPNNVIDLANDLKTMEDTAAVISELDLVITSCTSVAHLSAALGKETWVLTPLHPYYTWATAAPDLTATPYYKTVEIFRQCYRNRWNEPFQRLHRRLETKLSLPYQSLPNRDR